MTLRELVLFMTMPIWLPTITFVTIFAVVMAIPLALHVSLLFLGTVGNPTVLLGMVGAFFGYKALTRVPWTSIKFPVFLPDPIPLATIECPRCHSMDATNLKGGKFRCMLCSFQKT